MIAISAIALLWLPGLALAHLLRVRIHRDPVVALSMQIGLGISLWPILFLVTSTIGLHWQRHSAVLVAAALMATGAGIAGSKLRNEPLRRYIARIRSRPLLPLALFLLTLLTLWTRATHIQDLALPPWVDSVHHVMLTRLLVEQGAVPVDYTPFISDSRAYYHWGFHVLAAWLGWLTARTDGIGAAANLLIFGQVLNGLMLPALYAAARVLFHSRRAGIYCALLGMLVSWLPAYYLSWGRYTHLLGVLLAIPLLLLLCRIAIRPRWGDGVAAVLMAAALILIHIRVALFLIVTMLVLGCAILAAHPRWRTRAKIATVWGAVALCAGALTSPWLLWLAMNPRLQRMVEPDNVARAVWWAEKNEFPWTLLWIPHNHGLLALATAGVSLIWDTPVSLSLRLGGLLWAGIVLVAFWTAWRNRGFEIGSFLRRYMLAPVVCATLLLGINVPLGTAPGAGLVNNASLVITLFLPLSLAGGGLLAWVTGILTPRRYGALLTLLLVILVGGWGAYQMRTIVNPETILAGHDDLQMMAWIRENVAEDAKFAVNVKRWQANSYIGTDGGYWLQLLTDRGSITPPSLYTIAMPRTKAEQINQALSEWAGFTSLQDPGALEWLNAQGVTHLYHSGQGGNLDLRLIQRQYAARFVHRIGEVHVFELCAAGVAGGTQQACE